MKAPYTYQGTVLSLIFFKKPLQIRMRCDILIVVVYAPVAQLDRVSDSDSEGRAFESRRAYQKQKHSKECFCFWYDLFFLPS